MSNLGFNRQLSTKTIKTQKTCVCVSGFMQNQFFINLMESSDDGLEDRFWFFFPETIYVGYKDMKQNDVEELPNLSDIFEKIENFKLGDSESMKLELSEEADRLFGIYYDFVTVSIKDEKNPNIYCNFLNNIAIKSKSRGLVLRIAASLHALIIANSGSLWNRLISPEAMQGALDLANVLVDIKLCWYTGSKKKNDLDLINVISNKFGNQEFQCRDIVQSKILKCPISKKPFSSEETKVVLAPLIEKGYIEEFRKDSKTFLKIRDPNNVFGIENLSLSE